MTLLGCAGFDVDRGISPVPTREQEITRVSSNQRYVLQVEKGCPESAHLSLGRYKDSPEAERISFN